MQEIGKTTLIECKLCGISEPLETLVDGVCIECTNEKKYSSAQVKNLNDVNQNSYLALGFFEFAIIATLMIVFFPFSLLFCIIFYGLENTKYIIIALLHDLLATIFAVFVILVPIAIILIIVIISFAK